MATKFNLKSCPFCGGEASRGVGEIDHNPWYFECQVHGEHCGAEIRMRYSVPRWVEKPEVAAKRYISCLWNRRTICG